MNGLPSTGLVPAPSASLLPAGLYPTGLIDLRDAPGTERLLLRPVLPQDDLALAELLGSLSPQARRNRFHGPVKLSFADVQRLCRIDYRRHLALVVVAESGDRERIVADARFVVDDGGRDAEAALLVREGWQRRGIGSWALQVLERAARRAGLGWLTGGILPGNGAMLALARRRGYALAADCDDPHLVRAQLRLDDRGAAPSPAPAGLQGWLGRLTRRGQERRVVFDSPP